MRVYLILGIYYEEDYYRCETVEGVNLTLEGAVKKLIKLIDTKPYDEYDIRLMRAGK